MDSKKNNEPFDWTSVLQSSSNTPSQDEKLPASAFSSLFDDFKKPGIANKADSAKNKNFNNKRRHIPRKKSNASSSDHDKNENVLTRSNALPVSPSDDVQVRSYINLLEEFMANTENVKSNTKSDVDSFISVVHDFEKSLNNITVNTNSKEIVLEKLVEIQNMIALKIQSLDPKYNRTESWVKDLVKDNKFNLASPMSQNYDNVETSSYRSNARSNASVKSVSSLLVSKEDFKQVNCQYCCELIPDLAQLIKHLDYDCRKFLDRDFDTSKRNDLSYFQIMPDDKIKCNICDIKLTTLTRKKEHEHSHQHKKQVEKLKTRDAKRQLTNYIYCSCCKINVPDTFIQFKMHMDNPEHIEEKNKKNLGELAEKGFVAVVLRNNRLKCLACSHVDFAYEKDKFQHHINDSNHVKNVQRKKMGTPIYCELCDENITAFTLDFHINSQMHSDNLKMSKNVEAVIKNQYCLFCNKPFSNLTNMAVHQESSCIEIQNIRKLHQKSKENLPVQSSEKQTVRNVFHNWPVMNVNEEEEEVDEEPFLTEKFNEFFKDKDWIENAAVLLKQKSEKCNVDLDESIAKECAEELNCKIYIIFGSRNCNLAFDNSDLNIYCDFFGTIPLGFNAKLIKITAEECFNKLYGSSKFEDVQLFDNEASPFLQCVHIASKRICKIVFRMETSELESDFFKNCLQETPKIHQFLLCLKLWLKVHSSYLGEFSNFVLTMLGVFFLRSEAALVLPPPVLSDNISKELTTIAQSQFGPSIYRDKITIGDLFLKFCMFYRRLDYSSLMLFTGINKPLLKSDFESVLFKSSDKVPENNFTKRQTLWLVSHVNPNLNIGKDVTKKMLNRFMKVCGFTADRINNS